MEQGHVQCQVVVLIEPDGHDISLNHLSDSELKEIGFQRIPKEEPRQDMFDINRSFA
jgi:hypothetical protein